MKIAHCTIDFKSVEGTINTPVGECGNFSEAHDLIAQDVLARRQVIKDAWEKHFDFPWPGFQGEITMTQQVVRGVIVVIVNSSEVEWYEIK